MEVIEHEVPEQIKAAAIARGSRTMRAFVAVSGDDEVFGMSTLDPVRGQGERWHISISVRVGKLLLGGRLPTDEECADVLRSADMQGATECTKPWSVGRHFLLPNGMSVRTGLQMVR